MKRTHAIALTAALLFLPVAAPAKVDLVTLPERDKVQLTIYNSADITLARDWRELTMKKGENRLQFSWANTLIDPTSLLMVPRARAGEITVQDLIYPPRITGLGVWQLDSEISGKVPFEISYFTSGVSWKAYYLATLTPDERAMRLEGYVRVNNSSGEDYENAETRLIVGSIHILDQIAELARRQWPYGRPGYLPPPAAPATFGGGATNAVLKKSEARAEMVQMVPKEIRKEGLSEYFLYTIEGTETIPSGWGKRLISFTAEEVPVTYLFRYEEERYGSEPVGFLTFANDEAHRLGKEPIPDGAVKVFRRLDDEGRLSFLGARDIKYVPKGETVELNLGLSGDILVRPVEIDLSTENYEFENYEITGWDEHHTVKIEVANYRPMPVRVAIRRSFPTTSWELENEGDFGKYEKVDADTVEYSLELAPNARKSFIYRALWYMGSRKR